MILARKKICLGLAGLLLASTATTTPTHPLSALVKTGLGATCCYYLGQQTYQKAQKAFNYFKLTDKSLINNEIDTVTNDLFDGNFGSAFDRAKTGISTIREVSRKKIDPRELTAYYGAQAVGLGFLTLCAGCYSLFYLGKI